MNSDFDNIKTQISNLVDRVRAYEYENLELRIAIDVLLKTLAKRYEQEDVAELDKVLWPLRFNIQKYFEEN